MKEKKEKKEKKMKKKITVNSNPPTNINTFLHRPYPIRSSDPMSGRYNYIPILILI